MKTNTECRWVIYMMLHILSKQFTHTRIQIQPTNIHFPYEWIPVQTHVCMRMCMCMFVWACVVRACACIRACACVNVCLCMCVYSEQRMLNLWVFRGEAERREHALAPAVRSYDSALMKTPSLLLFSPPVGGHYESRLLSMAWQMLCA